MANFGILAKLGVESSKFVAGLKKAGDKASGFGKKLGAVVKAGAAVAGAAIAAMALKGVADFMEFEKKMTEVFTLLPKSTKEAEKQMSDDMRNLATTMGIDVIDATNALYQAISAGVPEENAAEFLEVASKAAIAGVSDLETSVAALTTIMNGYSMDVSEASRVSDVLFSVVKIGVTNFTELGQNIGKVTPLAAELGISIEEVGGMFSVLTKTLGAGKTAEAGTAIRSMLAELSKEGMKAFENFVEATGTTFPNFIRAGGSVADALKKMQTHAKDSGKGLMDMFRGVESGMGALTLAKNETEDLSEAVKNIKEDAGSTETAYQQMAATTAKAWDDMKAKLNDFGMAMGELLLPLVTEVVEAIGEAFEWLQEKLEGIVEWIKENPKLWTNLGKAIKVVVAAIIGYNAVAILTAAKMAVVTAALVAKKIALGLTSKAWKAMSLAMTANPLGAALAVLSAIVAAVTLWGDSAAEAAKKAREEAEAYAEEQKNAGKEVQQELDGLIKKNKELTETLRLLNREEEIAGTGIGARKTKLQMQKEALKVMQDDLAATKKKVASERNWNHEMNKIMKKRIAGMKDENAKTKAQADLNLDIIEQKKEEQELENKILELTIAEKKQLELIAETEKDIAETEAKRLKSMEEARDVIADIAREHELSQTSMGKIILAADKLAEIEEERAQILKDLEDGKQGEEDSIKRLGELEKDRLKTQKQIADIMLGDLNNLRKDEIDLIQKGVAELQKQEAAQERIMATEEAKLKTLDKQLQVQRDKVTTAEAEAERFEKLFAGNKFELGGGDQFGERVRRGVGEFKLSSAKLAREFKLLKAEGKNFREATQEDVDQGKARRVGDKIEIRNAREFQKEVERQLREKKDAAAAEKREQQRLQNARDAAAARFKEAEKEKKRLAAEIAAEEKKILDLRNKMNDKEVKTLQQITAERIRLEKALAQVRQNLQGAALPKKLDFQEVMNRFGVQVGNLVVEAVKVAEPPEPQDPMYAYRGEDFDPFTGERLKKTETELEGANDKLFDIRASLEGKFVNQ